MSRDRVLFREDLLDEFKSKLSASGESFGLSFSEIDDVFLSVVKKGSSFSSLSAQELLDAFHNELDPSGFDCGVDFGHRQLNSAFLSIIRKYFTIEKL